MAVKRKTGGAGDYARSFSTEDNEMYRGFHQELGPAMKRVEQIRELQEGNNYNPSDRQYIGSVPWTVLIDWLKNHGYTIDQFARKEGNVRQEFMRFFLSRDFSKLHTQHSTTRVGTGNRIVVPNNIGGHNERDQELRRAKAGDS